jgi:hypothetical protein
LSTEIIRLPVLRNAPLFIPNFWRFIGVVCRFGEFVVDTPFSPPHGVPVAAVDLLGAPMTMQNCYTRPVLALFVPNKSPPPSSSD